jgi:hypothetical protein
MNERIDELMIEAGARFEFLHGVHYDDFQYKKFAELIVRECLVRIEQYKNTGITKQIADEGVYSYEQGCIAGMTQAVLVIKEHFGVEE